MKESGSEEKEDRLIIATYNVRRRIHGSKKVYLYQVYTHCFVVLFFPPFSVSIPVSTPGQYRVQLSPDSDGK